MKGKLFIVQGLVTVFALHLWVGQLWAASLQYSLPGTSVTFADSGGTVAMTFSNKATGSGQVSGLYDKGAGAQPSLWQAQCQISLTGTNVPGTAVEYYFATSQDGTTIDGGVTSNAALASSDKRRNLTPMGLIIVDQATSNITMYATFRNLYVPSRYFATAFYNNSGLTTETSTTKHKCVWTPMSPQMQ